MLRKTYLTQPKAKQRLAAEKILENNGNVSLSMRQAGYSVATAKNPKDLLKSKGFRQIAEELGLTDKYVLNCLKDDIEVKKDARKYSRLGELTLASKILGLTKESEGNTTNILVLPSVLMDREGLTEPYKEIEGTE